MKKMTRRAPVTADVVGGGQEYLPKKPPLDTTGTRPGFSEFSTIFQESEDNYPVFPALPVKKG